MPSPTGPDRRGPHPDFSRWIVNVGGTPRGRQTIIDPPVPAVAHARLYDGTVEDVDVEVVARLRDMLCVSQHVDSDGRPGEWLAWLPARDVRRR